MSAKNPPNDVADLTAQTRHMDAVVTDALEARAICVMLSRLLTPIETGDDIELGEISAGLAAVFDLLDIRVEQIQEHADALFDCLKAMAETGGAQ